MFAIVLTCWLLTVLLVGTLGMTDVEENL